MMVSYLTPSASIEPLADLVDFPDASPFTSMMSLDVEKELGIAFDRARVHGKLHDPFISGSS